jgi:hypothetical protein
VQPPALIPLHSASRLPTFIPLHHASGPPRPSPAHQLPFLHRSSDNSRRAHHGLLHCSSDSSRQHESGAPPSSATLIHLARRGRGNRGGPRLRLRHIHLVSSAGKGGLRHRSSPPDRSWPCAMLCFKCFWMFFRHVASLCFKCFGCFRCMFQLFHADVANIDRDIFICCNGCTRMLQASILNISSFFIHIYCKCFRHMSQVFHLSFFIRCKCCIWMFQK